MMVSILILCTTTPVREVKSSGNRKEALEPRSVHSKPFRALNFAAGGGTCLSVASFCCFSPRGALPCSLEAKRKA